MKQILAITLAIFAGVAFAQKFDYSGSISEEDEQSYLEDIPFGSKLSIFDDTFQVRADKEEPEEYKRPERNADHSPYVNPFSGYVAHPPAHSAYSPAPAPAAPYHAPAPAVAAPFAFSFDHAPAPAAPYHAPAPKVEPYHAPAPAPYVPPTPAYHQPAPYVPPTPAYHEPAPIAPYHTPAPVAPYHAPVAPYHAPEPYAPPPPKPAYHEPAPAPGYGAPEPGYGAPAKLKRPGGKPDFSHGTDHTYKHAPHHPPHPAPGYGAPHAPHHPVPHHDPHHHGHPKGVCGVDFPCHTYIPPSKFTCAATPIQPGMYVDLDSGCQVYRVCNDGRGGPQGDAFLCPNGTIFNQKHFECDHFYNVDCPAQAGYWDLNLDPHLNPFVHPPKPGYDAPHPAPHHAPHPAPHHAPHPAPHHAALHHPAPHHAPVHHPAPHHAPLHAAPHHAPLHAAPHHPAPVHPAPHHGSIFGSPAPLHAAPHHAPAHPAPLHAAPHPAPAHPVPFTVFGPHAAKKTQ